MKHYILTFLLLQFFNLSYSQNEKYNIDFTDPISVVKTVKYAFESNDFEILQLLPDPFGECDGDVKQLKEILYTYRSVDAVDDAYTAMKFIRKSFEGFDVNGNVSYLKVKDDSYRYSKNILTNTIAVVPVRIKKNNEILQREVRLIKRYDNWYWYSF